jgi:hypothetical protein
MRIWAKQSSVTPQMCEMWSNGCQVLPYFSLTLVDGVKVDALSFIGQVGIMSRRNKYFS